MNGDGARLRAAAEDLELDGDACEQRQHDAGGDHADGSLHRGAPHQADAVDQGAQIANVERGSEGNTDALMRRAREWSVGIVPDRALQTGSDAAIDAIRALSARVDQIYLSVDLDVLPHAQMSAVSAPAGRGIPLHVVENLIDAVFRYGRQFPLPTSSNSPRCSTPTGYPGEPQGSFPDGFW